MNYNKLKLLLLLSLAILLLGCGEKSKKENLTSSRNLYDWSGFYQGVLIEADQQETYVDIEIKKDSTFIKREKKLKTEDKLMTINGTFTWTEDGNNIVLKSDFEAYDSILLVDKDKLVFKRKLDKEISPQDMSNYILTKIPGILLEREWKVTKLSDSVVNIIPQGDNNHINIYFDSDENKAYGFGGSNFYRTSYYLVGNEVSFTPVMSTKMAGPNIKTENKFFSSLKQVKRYEIVGKELFLKDDKGINLITAKVTSK